MANTPKYPDITAKLTDEDGNVYAIIGMVCKALYNGGVDRATVDQFRNAAFAAGSYDGVLQLCMEWVEVS